MFAKGARAALLTGLAVVMSGCHSHPLPEDFSRKKTIAIVKRMRCEIAEGVKAIPNATPAELQNTMAGFDFTLTMTEENDASSAKLSLLAPFSDNKVTIDLNGKAEKTRSNARGFRIIDSFANLQNESGCSDLEQRANFVYPVAGRIGLSEIVATYWTLKTNYKFNLADENRAFTDKLTFTTVLSVGLSPTITLAARDANFQLSNASFEGSVLRSDEHQVTIAMVQTPPSGGGGKTGKSTQKSRDYLGDQPFEPYMSTPSSSGANSINRALDRELLRDDLRDRNF